MLIGAAGLLLGQTAPARANPVELFGFGSRHAARAGAVSALVDDYAAGYYNPAGLAFGRGKQVAIGGQGFVSNLLVNEDRVDITEPLGSIVGLRLPAPLGGPLEGKLTVGLGMYILPRTMAQVIARFPDEPFYPYYDNRTQRIVILPSAAWRVTSSFSVGIAVNYLATLTGKVIAAEGSTRAIEARVDEKIPSIARFNVGAVWHGPFGLRLALAARQKFDIPFATLAKTTVAGQPIDLDIAASGQFTPTQVVIGGGWVSSAADESSLDVDVTWANWSAYEGPFVRVRSELPLVGPLASALPAVPYSDTIGIRIGGETHLGVGPVQADGRQGRIALRGGYGFETSAFPAEQSGTTNLLDGPKHIVAGGAGIEWPRAFGHSTVRVDAHAMVQIVGGRTLEKRLLGGDETYNPFTSLRDEVIDKPDVAETQGIQISNPGYPSITSGGQVFSAGISAEVDF